MTTIVQLISEGVSRCVEYYMSSTSDHVKDTANFLVKAISHYELLVLEKEASTHIEAQIRAGHVPAGLVMTTGITHIPYTSYWIEWPNNVNNVGFRSGFFVERAENNSFLCVFVMSDMKQWCPVFSAHIKVGDERHTNGEYTSQLVAVNERLVNSGMDMDHLMEVSIGELLLTNFALSVPRLTQTVTHVPPGKVNKKRLKNNKPPLIEFKRVTLDLGKTYNRYEPTGVHSLEEHKKRLHQVQGHIRVLTKERDEPKISWVSPHWRGDPKIGMILHDKHITP